VKCFYDANEAVGICKNCGRGVCEDSGVTLGKSLACKGRCEDEVGTINDLFARNRTIYQKTAGIYWRYALIPALFAVLLLGYPLIRSDAFGPLTAFYAGLGFLMLVAAGIAVYNGRRLQKR
jgi:hypothetical protein